MAALCCKESKTLCLSKKQPYAVVAAFCCRNVKTFCLSNGPTFAVLVKFRIPLLPPSPVLKNNYPMTKECGTKQNTARQLLQARYNQSRGTSLKDNTQKKLRSDSANVTLTQECKEGHCKIYCDCKIYRNHLFCKLQVFTFIGCDFPLYASI